MPNYHFFTTSKSTSTLPHLFFNSPEYLSLQNPATIHSFLLQAEDSERLLARIHFKIENKIAYNPSRAPFGGLEISLFDLEKLSAFWKQVEETLRKAGVKRIEIRSWPDAYLPKKVSFFTAFFKTNGFEILFSDFSFHHAIKSTIAFESFHKSEQKRFRKCKRAGFTFQQWHKPDVALAHDLLLQFRLTKNIPLNIKKEELMESIEKFPNRYNFFVVNDGDKIIGLSLCVEVNKKILYHFCLATDSDYQSFSPSVMLYEGIYRYCAHNSYQLFDSGTASIEGKKQEGLYLFKEHVGAIVTPKPTYFKILDSEV